MGVKCKMTKRKLSGTTSRLNIRGALSGLKSNADRGIDSKLLEIKNSQNTHRINPLWIIPVLIGCILFWVLPKLADTDRFTDRLVYIIKKLTGANQ